MRNQFGLALLASATLSGAAFAAPGADNNIERAPAAAAAVCSIAPYQMKAAELDGVAGEFSLSDGRRLTVTARYGKLFAKIGGTRTEIVAVAQNRFASRDDKLQLEFDQLPFANTVRLTN
jgi:hypothetical protein